MRSLSIASTGMLAQQLNVETISNNIANSQTTGFKRQRAEFQDLLYQSVRRQGSTTSDANTVVPSGIQIGAGVRPAAIYRISTQGAITVTDNKLDLAVNGNGWFPVLLPSGETGYTRAGAFQLNATGDIVTADGYRLQPTITIPASTVDITISATGQVQAKLDGTANPVQVGQIQLATFPSEGSLEAIGNNLFLETPSSGAATLGNPENPGYGKLIQGSLENSNVNIVQEITSLISAQRAYEMNSKVIKTTDEMMQSVNALK